MSPPTPVLRPATPDDADLQFQLFVHARRTDLTVPGWTAAQQEAFLQMQYRLRTHGYRTQYPGSVTYIALLQGVPVAELIVDRGPGTIRVVDVTVLPVYHVDGVPHPTAGIGRLLIAGVIAESKQTSKPILAQVVKLNRALALWRRMGFVVIGDDGVHLTVEWRPGSSAPAPLNGT